MVRTAIPTEAELCSKVCGNAKRADIEDYVRTVLITQLNGNSSPGFPYEMDYPDNKSFVSGDPDRLVQLATDRIMLYENLTDQRLQEVLLMTPEGLIVNGFTDGTNVFIKNESHPKRKVDQGRYRIICSMSVVDQLVERWFYSDYHEALLGMYPNSPLSIGIGFSDRENQLFASKIQLIQEIFGTSFSSDVPGFDNTVSTAGIRSGLETIEETTIYCSTTQKVKYRRVGTALAHVLTNRVYIIDSRMYVLPKPGKLPSGCYNTSVINSIIRITYAMYCHATYCQAAGDDAIDSFDGDIDHVLVLYKKRLEIDLREVKKLTADHFEYCSHTYNKGSDGFWTASLNNYAKTFHKLFTGGMNNEQVAAVAYEIRHNSDEVKTMFDNMLKTAVELRKPNRV
jgi:hypothetical protein